MPKKYIKGKDGKFKGSLPDPTILPNATNISSLPTLPTNTSKPLESILAVPERSFYVSSQDKEFILPANIVNKLERGDLAHFADEHILYTDSYGEQHASYYEAFPKRPELLIDLETEKNGKIAENIRTAESFSQLDEETKDYFLNGGCAALAVEIYNRLPGSKLNIVIAAMIDDPDDATVAHVYVSQGWENLDGFGRTKLASYDYVAAAGVDPDFMEVLTYESTSDTVKALIEHGCFGNEFTDSSNELIGRVAELIIGNKG